MALLNGMYIFVKDENVDKELEVTQHPVEDGLDLTDHARRLPTTVDLSGKIVGEDAPTVLQQIRQLHEGGKLVKYQGRNIITGCIISALETSHPNTTYGGCSFTMRLQEIRVAKSPYVPGSSGTQKVEEPATASAPTERYHVVKSGDTLWGIAKAYYGNGARYTEIYEANKQIIGSNANIIKVGQRLLIP